MIESQNVGSIQNSLLLKVLENDEKEIENLVLEKEILKKSDKLEDRKRVRRIDMKLKKLKAFKKIEDFGGTFNNFDGDLKSGCRDCRDGKDQEVVYVGGEISVDSKIWQQLLPHQKNAMEWLYCRYQQKTGGLLGDEMGLGKTVMVSVFLQALQSCNKLSGGILLISPATLIPQWQSELSKWAPSLKVTIYKSDKNSIHHSTTSPFGLTLITYEILHTHHKKLHRPSWFYLILDEGHKIKNPSSQLTRLCKSFKSTHRLLLSGTPIQNSLNELWSLFDFVYPGLLGTEAVFAEQFGEKITKAGYCRSTELEVEVAFECAVQLRKMISPYILRRTKKEIDIGIPEHQEKILFCQLEIGQWEAYVKYLDLIVDQKVKDVKVCIKDLRLICNCPRILRSDIISRLDLGENNFCSGKIKAFKELLKQWNQDVFLVVFSQYKKMLDLTQLLVQEFGIPCGRIDGNVLVNLRMQIIQDFNMGKINVLLLTTKVGGFGINLPRATQVLLLDPDWNPMNDNQAKERALRIGQQNNLLIYRFITKDTIEEKIYNKQLFKLMVAEKVKSIQILINPEQKRFFATQDIHNLFHRPPAPLERTELIDEFLPKVSKKQNKLFEVVLGCEAKNISVGSAVDHSSFSNLAEMSRIKQHAQQLASLAVRSLAQSSNVLGRAVNVTSGVIGTGKVRQVLLNKPLVTVLNKPKRFEEVLIHDLHLKFKENNCVLETDRIIQTFNEEMKGFDKFLLRDILKQLAQKEKDGLWVLRREFHNI